MMTKTQLAAVVASGQARESFDHHLNGVVTRYDVTAMRERAAKEGWEVCTADIALVLDHLTENHVWEKDRILSLTREEWLDDPAIVVVEPGANGGAETHLVVDGVHRILRRHCEGLGFFRFYEARGPQVELVKPGWGSLPSMDWGQPLEDGVIRRG